MLLLWLAVAGILICARKQQPTGDGESRILLSKGELNLKIKIEKGGFALKNSPEEFKDAAVTGHFGFSENLDENHNDMFIVSIV